jgi:hypothetical protein
VTRAFLAGVLAALAVTVAFVIGASEVGLSTRLVLFSINGFRGTLGTALDGLTRSSLTTPFEEVAFEFVDEGIARERG